MNVCGIDASTYAVDFVFLHETGHAEWRRVTLEGQDAWERTRSLSFPSSWLDDTEACGIEVAHGPSSGQINRVIGAVMARLPRSLLLQPWTSSAWKKACGMSGHATKADVRAYSIEHWWGGNVFRAPAGPGLPRRVLHRQGHRASHRPEESRMTHLTYPRTEPITCPQCGGERYISRRHALAIQAGEHLNLCRNCRYKSQVRVTNRYRNWWLDRYTMDEIRWLAEGLVYLNTDDSSQARERRGA